MADQRTDEIPDPPNPSTSESPVHLPRIKIRYCTQCKWMLRAAYFAQELLSTFSTSLGEVALIPTTGGVFTVTILHSSNADFTTQKEILWDRKSEGGFPEVKHLKSLVRNIIDPSRDLGHIDRSIQKSQSESKPPIAPEEGTNKSKPLTLDSVRESPGGSGRPGGVGLVRETASDGAEADHKHEDDEKCEDCA